MRVRVLRYDRIILNHFDGENELGCKHRTRTDEGLHYEGNVYLVAN